ncbi:MAG: hypothetical protein MJ010_06580 [Paludibacteraceae bacterium]|nr:hypothetical protein [Paludibacteraceae bacterium]
MKKIIYIMGAALVMLASVSCKKNDAIKGDEQSSVKKVDMEFTATSKGALKTTVKPDGTTVVWSEGDAIKVFTASDTQGSTLSLKSGDGKSTAVFSGQCSETGPWTAIYPSSMAKSFADGVITFAVPATQTYAGATFAKGTMPSVAYSTTTDLEFKHAFGVLKLQLKGEGSVKNIKVTNANGERINGSFTVNPSTGNVTAEKIVDAWPATPECKDGTRNITLDCGTGVALSAGQATEFWIVVPAGAFAKGLEVNITSTDNRKARLYSAKDNTIKAGEIKPMPEMSIVFEEQLPTVKDVCNNEYPVVKIGNQYWMAENMRCNKYEDGVLGGATLKKVEDTTFDPYYAEYSDGSWYDDYMLWQWMDEEQYGKLGLLYNWAAAVGIATGEEAIAQVGIYEGVRQGICPNGWHIPSEDEWHKLRDYVEGRTDWEPSGERSAGYHLKSATGWDPSYGDGADNATGLSLLGGGQAQGNSQIGGICVDGCYISADSYYDPDDPSETADAFLGHTVQAGENHLDCTDNHKEEGFSVRCIKDTPAE